MNDKPAFEIRCGDKIYKIYANGRTEGFDSDAMVVNRIPVILAEAMKRQDTGGRI